MAQTEVRLRIDRSFAIDTDPAKALQYLSVVANQESRAKIDLIQELICRHYLPFALEGSLSTVDRSKVLRSVYALESEIQQILALWNMSDPRFRVEAQDVSERLDVQSVATHAMVNPMFSPDVESEAGAEVVETEEVDDETAMDGMRSTVSRMII